MVSYHVHGCQSRGDGRRGGCGAVEIVDSGAEEVYLSQTPPHGEVREVDREYGRTYSDSGRAEVAPLVVNPPSFSGYRAARRSLRASRPSRAPLGCISLSVTDQAAKQFSLLLDERAGRRSWSLLKRRLLMDARNCSMSVAPGMLHIGGNQAAACNLGQSAPATGPVAGLSWWSPARSGIRRF